MPTPAIIESIHIAPGRGFTFDVVGESQWQANLEAVCGAKTEDGHRKHVIAELCFEDGNAADSEAVVVLIAGFPVGYVPREKANGVREEILRLNPDERYAVTCDAKIVGGWRREDGDEGHFGVKLSLSSPMRKGGGGSVRRYLASG